MSLGIVVVDDGSSTGVLRNGAQKVSSAEAASFEVRPDRCSESSRWRHGPREECIELVARADSQTLGEFAKGLVDDSVAPSSRSLPHTE